MTTQTKSLAYRLGWLVRAGLYIVKLVNKPIQSNEFHSIMDDLYQSIISH
ncbi:hypothetical protein [Shewanella oncorhynchi]